MREVRHQAKEMGSIVRLYANMSAVGGFLPERLGRFMAQHPAVEVSLHEADMRLNPACLDDRADVGVGVESSVPMGLGSW